MGLFSLFRKNKQDSASDQGEFRSRSEEQSSALRSRSSRAANTSGRAAGGRGKAGKEAAADPLLPEKKRARRRLIGAVALALAVIIVLPMILDSEPKPLNEDIAIQIPSKEQPAGVAPAQAQPELAQPVEIGRQAAASAALDQKEEIVEPSGVKQAPPVATPQSVTPPVAAVAPAKPADKPVAKPATRPEEKKPAVAEHKEEPKKDAVKKDAPKKASEPQGDDSARALAILEGKSGAGATTSPAEKKPAAAGGKFVIQVAALATQDKVNELRHKLSGAGIHSYTQKIATDGGERTRIRVGPFASRDEAERMGARIKKLGLNATIVPA